MTAAAVLTDHVCPNKLNPVAISGNCKWSFIKKSNKQSRSSLYGALLFLSTFFVNKSA